MLPALFESGKIQLLINQFCEMLYSLSLSLSLSLGYTQYVS